MKKVFTSLCIFFLSCGFVFGEKLPPKDSWGDITPETTPVIYKYFTDYNKALFYAYDPKHYPFRGYCAIEVYTINKDGTITDRLSAKNENKYDINVKNFILNNPPPPFPEGMDEQRVKMHVSICTTPSYNEIKTNYYAYKEQVNMSVSKDIRHKNMTLKKCSKQGGVWNGTKNWCELEVRNLREQED